MCSKVFARNGRLYDFDDEKTESVHKNNDKHQTSQEDLKNVEELAQNGLTSSCLSC